MPSLTILPSFTISSQKKETEESEEEESEDEENG